MKDYIEYLSLPGTVVAIIFALMLFMQVVGEIVEFTGKAVPEFMKIRKYFKRKKRERETLASVETTLAEVKQTLVEFNAHYNDDNITKRNDWMHSVDAKQEQDHEWLKRLDEKLDKNNSLTLSILIENKRSEIIGFASYVIDESAPATHEQFNRIFKMYADYEAILKEHNMTNGEANVAMRIIKEAYEARMRGHSFVEDTRWER